MSPKIPNGVKELHRRLRSDQNPTRACLDFCKSFSDTRVDKLTLTYLSILCLRCGLEKHLVFYLAEQLRLGATIPWGHFAEACLRIFPWTELKAWILSGVKDQSSELALSPLFLTASGESKKYKILAQAELNKKSRALQEELLNQLEMYSLQGLSELEAKVLEELEIRFPHLPGLESKLKKLKTKKALEALDRKLHQKYQEEKIIPRWPSFSPEERKVLTAIEIGTRLAWQKRKFSSEAALDFALMHYAFENYQECLHYLTLHEQDPRQFWLYLEVLFKIENFLQLLHESIRGESRWAEHPEMIWGLNYFKALALWNLCQKKQGYAIMEELAQVKPDYRASSAILTEWAKELK